MKIIKNLKKEYKEDVHYINKFLLAMVIVFAVSSIVITPLFYDLEDKLLDYEEMNETFKNYNLTEKLDLIRENEQGINALAFAIFAFLILFALIAFTYLICLILTAEVPSRRHIDKRLKIVEKTLKVKKRG